MMSSSSLELAYGLLAPLLVLLFSIKLSNSSSIFESELSCFPFPFLAAADEEPLVLISLNKSSASSLSLLSILYLVVALLRLTLSRAIGATSDRSPPPSESESIFSSSSLDSQGFFLFNFGFGSSSRFFLFGGQTNLLAQTTVCIFVVDHIIKLVFFVFNIFFNFASNLVSFAFFGSLIFDSFFPEVGCDLGDDANSMGRWTSLFFDGFFASFLLALSNNFQTFIFFFFGLNFVQLLEQFV